MSKKIFKFSFLFLFLVVFTIFAPALKIKASTPLELVSYEVSDTIISPNNDGIQDSVNIDIKYSEEVIADINILDEQGNKIREIYHSDAVTNPQTKIWDGKDDSNQIVSDGLYTIQILGTATADANNSISDTSKTISVNSSNPPIVHLDIETNVDVAASCSATDTDGVVHTYPKGDSYLAICALVMALEKGFISSVQFSNQFPNLGLFVTSINEVTADPTSQYWTIYQNGNSANSGIASLPVTAGDVIILQLHDFSDNDLGDQVTLYVRALISSDVPNSDENVGGNVGGNGGGNGGGGNPPSPTFDIQKALNYLESVQDADGSFGGSEYTDWAAIAFGAMNVTNSSKNKLLEYFNAHNTAGVGTGPCTLCAPERRAMALLALGQNPYSFNDVNYIGAITDSFDGTQFGDVDIINDDIFALIPLANAGYDASDDMIIKDIAFLISKQKNNGSWVESVDITAAAIQALEPFKTVADATESIAKAATYLENNQHTDGGWKVSSSSPTSSVFSTSWILQAMNALDSSWTKNGKSGMDYLGTEQVTDGAVSPLSETPENRIWATSYAIAAASEKPWSEIMQSVSKPVNQNNNQNNSNNSSGSTSEISNPQTPTSSVVCPTGDLFSTTTGQSCTTFTEREVAPSTTLIQTNLPQVNKTNIAIETKKTPAIAREELPTNTDTQEINPETLIAGVADAMPEKTKPSRATPIALGVLSGIAILYLGFKFLK